MSDYPNIAKLQSVYDTAKIYYEISIAKYAENNKPAYQVAAWTAGGILGYSKEDIKRDLGQ